MDDEGDRAPKSSAYQGAHGDKSGDHGDERSQEKPDKSSVIPHLPEPLILTSLCLEHEARCGFIPFLSD